LGALVLACLALFCISFFCQVNDRAVWQRHVDDASGYAYFYHPTTGMVV
jgi:surface polysaccharide O-acyltransferase-like enzyme